MRARRSAVVLLATGATCLAGAALPLFAASADSEPGSELGSYNLSANAPVLQVRYDEPGVQCSATAAGAGACEGVLNESVSSLRNGPVGHALSSVGWPGTLGGNLGSLLVVANSNVPSQATALNDPVKAENFTGRKDATVTNNQIPGATMTATATATKVSATSVIGAVQATPLGSLGQISSSSSTSVTGPRTAEAVAHSQVQDITLGPLHIGAIVSDAKATTDGKTAKPSGRTVVTGASVAGVPVSIDERGVTAKGQGAPVAPKQLTDAVNSALTQAGMTIALSAPTGKPDGPTVLYNAGALNIVWKIPSAPADAPSLPLPVALPKPGTASIMIGGAQVSVDATEGYSVDDGGSVPPYDGGTAIGGTGSSAAVPPLTSGTPNVSGTDPGSLPGPAVGGPLPVETAASSAPLPHGLSPWLGGLALVGAALVMAGLRRLPDHVLVAPASSCPRGDLA